MSNNMPYEASDVQNTCFCSHCGASIPADSVFCDHCGKPLNSVPGQSTGAPASSQALTSKFVTTKNKWVCGKCNTQFSKNSTFCGTCGAPRSEAVAVPVKALNLDIRSWFTTTKTRYVCGKCQSPFVNNSTFCGKCGAPRSEGVAAPVTTLNFKLLAAVIAVVLLIGFTCSFFLGRQGYKKVIDIYFKASFTDDADRILDILPDEVIEYALEEEGYDRNEYREGRKELQKYIEETLSEAQDYLDRYLGRNWDVSYEIESVEHIKGKDLREIREMYDDEGIDLDISEAMSVELQITVTASSIDDVTQYIDIPMIKVGNSWYVDALSMGGFF